MTNLDPNCVFCKIIAGDIPSHTVYEDDIVKAFLDLSQVTPGHVLVVPKQHIKDIFDYDSHQASLVFSRIPKIARAIKHLDPKIQGMNICINNGKIAYQSVFHSHIHLIPRYNEEDGFSMDWADNTEQYDAAQLDKIATTIQTNFGDEA